jgi:hypothetical protein
MDLHVPWPFIVKKLYAGEAQKPAFISCLKSFNLREISCIQLENG